jgi:hypothetical protein
LASKPNSEMLDTRMSHPWKLKISDFKRDPSQGAAPIADGVCNASLPAIRIYDPYPRRPLWSARTAQIGHFCDSLWQRCEAASSTHVSQELSTGRRRQAVPDPNPFRKRQFVIASRPKTKS